MKKLFKLISATTALLLTNIEIEATPTYSITNLSGTTIEISDPFYDGQVLKAKRAVDGLSFQIAPDLLTNDSWEDLNAETTKNLRVSLQVKPLKHSRRSFETYSYFSGTIEHTHVSRIFEIEVSSQSHFEKHAKVVCYWISGHSVNAETHSIAISRNKPFTLETGGSARQASSKAIRFPTNYKQRKETDFVVVVENSDGSICEIYATKDGAKDLIASQYTD